MTSPSLGSNPLTPRQRQLADAALVIIAREGLAGLSFRTVAAEADCSLGAVQKAFPRKETMLAAAFARLREQSVSIPSGEPGRPTLRAWLVSLMISILPLDAERRAAQRQAEAFALYSASDPAIAGAITQSDDQLRNLLASLVMRARSEGEIPATVDPQRTAWAVLALTQGLAAQLSYEPRPERELRERLEGIIASLLSGA